MHSNIAYITPVGHCTKLHDTTANTHAPPQWTKHSGHKGDGDDVRPQDSVSQVLRSSTLLSDILKQFNNELLKKSKILEEFA